MMANLWQSWFSSSNQELTQTQKDKKLYQAICDNKPIDLITNLLNNGADPKGYSDINSHYSDAFDCAIRTYSSAAKLLLQTCPNLDKTAAFFQAVKYENIDLFCYILDVFMIDINQFDELSSTALSYAACHYYVSYEWNNKINVVRELLARGANPNTVHDGSPLIVVAIEKAKPEIFSLLIQHSADLYFTDSDSRTALNLGIASQKSYVPENIFCLLNAMPIEKLNELEKNPVYKTTILHFKKAVLDIQKDIVNTLAKLYQDNTIEMNQEIDEYATSDIKDYIYQTLLTSMALPIWYQSRLPQDFNYLFFKKLPEKIKELEENNTLQDGISTSTSTMTFSAQASSGLKRNFEQDSNNEQEERPTKKRKTKP